MVKMRLVPAVIFAAVISVVGLTGSATAASTVQAGNCNNDYDRNPVQYSLVVRAPKVWANNGTTQAVRYRSLLDKWGGRAWANRATGVWRQGTATPNRHWQAAPGTWQLNPYGPGHYSVRVQVQYHRNGAWRDMSTTRIGNYYLMVRSGGQWSLSGNVRYCTAY